MPAFLAATVTGCLTSAPRTLQDLDELARASGQQTVVTSPALTIWSPYDVRTTAPIVDMLEQEQRAVFALMGIPVDPPVLVWLQVTASALGAESSLEELFQPSDKGVRGLAGGDGDSVQMYVPQNPFLAAVAADMIRDAARHELAHAAFVRAGLSGSRWLREGFARFVEHLRLVDGQLVPSPLPRAELADANAAVARVSVGDLLRWSGDMESIEWRRDRYALAFALTQFFLSRQPDGTLRDSAAGVARMTSSDALALEDSFHDWLGSIDFVGAIQQALAGSDDDLRREAARLLSLLAERGSGAAFGSEALDVALGQIADPTTGEPCASYLLFFRFKDVPQNRVAELAASDDPLVQLLGEALRVRRGEAVDRNACEDLWNRIPPNDQREWQVLHYFLTDGGTARDGA